MRTKPHPAIAVPYSLSMASPGRRGTGIRDAKQQDLLSVSVRVRAAPPPVMSSLDSFVGRERELESLRSAVSSSRLVVLTGPPGVGKTRLADELVARVGSSYADGAHIVEFGAFADPDLVAHAVADGLSIWEQPGLGLLDTLVARLRERRMLLALDNCEHVLEAASHLVRALLASCEHLTVLATSQIPLDVEGEQVWPISPLALPETGSSAEEIGASESVTLFSVRAAATARNFSLTTAMAPVLGEICCRLDGIPLAIELAAARVAILSPLEILSHLDDRFSLLTDGDRRAVLPQHQTLRAALDWSYQLLPEAEKTVLRRLSVFARHCTFAAVEFVCGYDMTRPQLMAALTGVVKRSLLIADTSQDNARYRMLETVRFYCAEQLSHSGERDETSARHAQWFAELASHAEPALTGEGQARCLEGLYADYDNLRTALAWSHDTSNSELALRLAGGLTLFWRVRGHFKEGQAWLRSAMKLENDPTPSASRARALWGAGFMALMLDDYAGATHVLDECLAMSRVLSDPLREARTLLLLGNCWMFKDRSAAVSLFDESIDLARRTNDTWCLAHALAMMGRAHLRRGDTDAARPHLEACLRVARPAKDLQSLRVGLISLGEMTVAEGDGATAEALLTEGIEMAQQLGEPYALATAFASMSELALDQGEPSLAEDRLATAHALAIEAGSPILVATVQCLLGRLAHMRGNIMSARRFYDDGASSASMVGRSFFPAVLGLAEVALCSQEWRTSRELHDQALSLADGGQSNRARARVLTSMGRLARAEGDPARASSRSYEALQLCRRVGNRPGIVESLDSFAGLFAARDRFDQAVRLFAAVDSMRSIHRHAQSPVQRDLFATDVATARDALGVEQFDTLWAQGTTLSLADAISCVGKGRGSKSRTQCGWASLTRSELDVARLVAEGYSNAEIARRRFISTRTVEGHVSQIFGKLAISSRTQLARVAAQQEGALTKIR